MVEVMHEDLVWLHSEYPPPDSAKIHESLHESLARAASLWPDSIAVVSAGNTFTFHELACRVAGLSSEIKEAANVPGPVALVQSVGFDAIAAWFACSLSGRPFILLEPDHPPARLLELIESAGCALVVSDHVTSWTLINLPIVNLLISDGRTGTLLPDDGLAADEPAMIFPTSGSTGKPKLITYAATTLQVKVQSSLQLMRVPKGARVVIAGSHGNYGFLHHALVFLLSGGAISLADVKSSGFDAILHAITVLGARHVRCTPSLFRKLAVMPKAHEALRLLDAVRFSGEPLLANDLTLARAVLKPECLIQNVYGSTESALFIWSCTADDMPATEPTAPIGLIYPLASYAMRPLGDKVEDAGTGELLIRSKYHALGDYECGTIDEERFPKCEDDSDDRVYATGDIVRQRADGNLILLGRSSRMAKVRGNRVYLPEVENHLRAIPGVTGATVVEHESPSGTVLFGFITADMKPISSDIARSWLEARLPSFMIPKSIETIEEIPLLKGGKVDYQTLINLIPSTHSNTHVNADVVEFVRLINLWDSILWAGAHEHDSDFLALGGDSLGLMTLSVKIEQLFGKRLSLEDFRNNSTLRNLTDILGIKWPELQVEFAYERIRAKPFGQRLNATRGVALAVPGYGGWAPVHPFEQAGLFRDYELWIADFPINEGSILDTNRWWKAALDIVDLIRQGAIPAPRVIFGYSIGGGLAWLVGRLLTETVQSPEFVVMVDASPLHRMPRFHSPSLTQALELVAHFDPPPALHIRRAPLDIDSIDEISTEQWKPEDNIRMVVDLPTIDHLDMVRWNMLSLANEAVASFLNHEEISDWGGEAPHLPDLFGVHMYRALNGNHDSLNRVLCELTNGSEIVNYEYLTALVFVSHALHYEELAIEFIRHGLKNWPYSRISHYLYRRLRRKANMLLSDDIPIIYPKSIVICETKLAMSRRLTDQPKMYPIRLMYMTLDVINAFFAAEWAKRWNRYSQAAE